MLKLPSELLNQISKDLSVTCYLRLRATCKSLSSLPSVPTLSFAAYKESTLSAGRCLRSTHRMHLALPFDSDSFLFLVKNRHIDEIKRVLRIKGAYISL